MGLFNRLIGRLKDRGGSLSDRIIGGMEMMGGMPREFAPRQLRGIMDGMRNRRFFDRFRDRRRRPRPMMDDFFEPTVNLPPDIEVQEDPPFPPKDQDFIPISMPTDPGFVKRPINDGMMEKMPVDEGFVFEKPINRPMPMPIRELKPVRPLPDLSFLRPEDRRRFLENRPIARPEMPVMLPPDIEVGDSRLPPDLPDVQPFQAGGAVKSLARLNRAEIMGEQGRAMDDLEMRERLRARMRMERALETALGTAQESGRLISKADIARLVAMIGSDDPEVEKGFYAELEQLFSGMPFMPDAFGGGVPGGMNMQGMMASDMPNMTPSFKEGGSAEKKYPNKGLAALAKVAPEVVKRMGYQEGGSVDIIQDYPRRSAEMLIDELYQALDSNNPEMLKSSVFLIDRLREAAQTPNEIVQAQFIERMFKERGINVPTNLNQMSEGGAVKLSEQSVEFMPGTDIGMMLDDLSDLKKKAQMMS